MALLCESNDPNFKTAINFSFGREQFKYKLYCAQLLAHSLARTQLGPLTSQVVYSQLEFSWPHWPKTPLTDCIMTSRSLSSVSVRVSVQIHLLLLHSPNTYSTVHHHQKFSPWKHASYSLQTVSLCSVLHVVDVKTAAVWRLTCLYWCKIMINMLTISS